MAVSDSAPSGKVNQRGQELAGADERYRAAFEKGAANPSFFMPMGQGVPSAAETLRNNVQQEKMAIHSRYDNAALPPDQQLARAKQMVAAKKYTDPAVLAQQGFSPEVAQQAISEANRPAAAAAPKPAPIAAPAAATGLAPQSRPGANQVPPEKMAALEPANQKVQQAGAQLAAVAKSGDQQAFARYAAILKQAQDERRSIAVGQLGQQGAAQYLSGLAQ